MFTMDKTLTQHKSVYLCFRPLLAVCKVFGSCAIQNSFSQDAQGLRYSYKNLWLLHCLVFHVGISLMMHTTVQLRRQSTPVTCFYDLRKWCFLAALLSTDHKRVNLLQGLEQFDSKIHSLNKITLIEYKPKVRGHFWHFIYHLVYTVGMNTLSYTLFYPRDKTTLALFFDVLVKTFAAEMVFSYTIINIVFNNELRFRYKVITASWIYHMRTLQANPVASVRIQERLRLLHAELTGLAVQLGSCFGRFFVVNLFFVFLETMMYLYRTLLAQTNVFSNVQSVLFLAVNVVSVPILASSSHQLTRSSTTILNVLREIRIMDLPKACGEQVVLFVKQLHRDPLAVSACGFFPIDRQLIISMIVSMTTYYMVIIQLGPELGRLTASLFGLE